ncbi:MAG: hypothetical protein AB1405_16370 [Bdellovibrionota bacterium]
MKTFKKKLDAIFLALVIALCGGAFLQSCGGGGGAILVAFGTNFFTISDLIVGANLTCIDASEGCSGDLTDSLVFESQVATGSTIEGADLYTIGFNQSDDDGTESASFDSEGVAVSNTAVATALVSAINILPDVDGTDQGEGYLIYQLTDGNDLFLPSNTVTSGGGGGEFGGDPLLLTGADLFAILAMLAGVSTPEGQDLVDEAVTDDQIDDTVDTTRGVSLMTVQEEDCIGGNGTVTATTTFSGTIDEDENVVDPSTTAGVQPVETLTNVIVFADCEITGDLLDDGDINNETIIMDGTITFQERSAEFMQGATLVRDDSVTFQTPAPLTLDTDDGTTATFWTDLLDADVLARARFEDGSFENFEANGGVCFGAQVQRGADNLDDEDDDCAAGGDRFLEAAAIVWFFDQLD